MADNTDKQADAPDAADTKPAARTAGAAQQIVYLAPPAVVAPAIGLDEIDEGGKYQVNGQWVDAYGNPLKGKG